VQKNNKRYDVMQDFAHVALLAQAQLLVASHPSLPTKTMQELIALAKRYPEKLTYASSGNGTTPHMLGALFTHATKLKIRHIPYKGGPQAWTALVSGEVDLIVGQVQQAIPLLKANRMKALAVFGAKRSSSLPNLPTFNEIGVKTLDVAVWYSIAIPARASEEIVNRLNKEINYALSDSGVKARLVAGGLQILPSTPSEATKFIGNELPRWAEAVRISGAKVD
jgi:tripartite-type tricarboxylate transporter receptor subunit TctC